ncbi:MAG: hypothetical protein ACXVB0_24750, partial [Mucilaginibacter sp.]
ADIAGVEPLAGPGAFAVTADPVTNMDVQGLEGRIGLEQGNHLPGKTIMDAAVGTRITIRDKFDAGGTRSRSCVERSAGTLRARDRPIVIFGSGDQAADIVGIQMVGGIGGGHRHVALAVTGGRSPLHLKGRIGAPLPEYTHGGIVVRRLFEALFKKDRDRILQ